MLVGGRGSVSLVFLVWLCVRAEDDLTCLTEFRSSVSDPLHSLANWDPAQASEFEGGVCSWTGVQCWNDAENKVMALMLPGAGLSGPLSLPLCSSLTRLNLSGNSLTGPLPSNICDRQLQSLAHLDLSHNLLDGSLPPDLGNCAFLNALYLQHNYLTGPIPSQLGNLSRLTNLDLSFNALSGPIPSQLCNLPQLNFLDLSSNNLSAPIPSTLANGSISNLTNNPLLCRPPPPPSESMTPAPSQTMTPARLHTHFTNAQLILICAPILLALALWIALVLAFQYWLHKLLPLLKQFCSHGDSTSHSHWFETHPKRRWEEVQHATSFFSPANIIGSGGSSVVYKGRLSDGREIAVKVLNKEQPSSQLQYTPEQLFQTELRLLGKLRHRNLVKVLGFFCNSEFMAIVFNYMPAGSLDALLLHESATTNLSFGWKARLNILLGIAEGLAYLHNEYDSKLQVIHADLKPANVLLDEYMEAHIADFGIATFVSTVHSSSVLGSASKGPGLVMPCWSLGYTAPECVQQGLVSCEGDIFSFGVIVLEMITGERPNSDKLKEGESLMAWVNESLAKGDMDRVIAPRLLSVYEMMRWRNELMAVLRMGCSCASMARSKRPNMYEVVTFLHRICAKLEDNPPFQAKEVNPPCQAQGIYDCEILSNML